ncbi:hypothetical protein O7598_30845 [Micromonospora sp. WMMC241]|uniref:hypothetical protein n=1 Tax=Micromonospora sp. WMMC241 TaxID=3015159 RepID=UPI0022B645D5|nr:hypothetical protein [Micromonospora sp. WMMC241]MCZ7440822.1 hypothetical protein [Micromonospora sp. WMMC241]
MADLFDLGDLPSWLQVPEVDAETATRVRRAANGWLQNATGLTSWPDPVPDRLWAWAVELAAIAFRNPSAALSERVDDYEFSADRARRAEILADARRAYPPAGSGPQWSFPEPDWSWTSSTVRG